MWWFLGLFVIAGRRGGASPGRQQATSGGPPASTVAQDALKGAATGAAFGSAIPGIGTAAGAGIGAGVAVIADEWGPISTWWANVTK